MIILSYIFQLNICFETSIEFLEPDRKRPSYYKNIYINDWITQGKKCGKISYYISKNINQNEAMWCNHILVL